MTDEVWNAVVAERNMDFAMRKHMREYIEQQKRKEVKHDNDRTRASECL